MTRRDPEDAPCPLCGGPRTSWGCRPVPLGDYCTVKGLREDLSRRPAVVDRDRPEERDSAVKAARAALAEAERQQEDATGRWEAAALAGWQARARRWAGSRDVLVDGMLHTALPKGTGQAAMRQLAEAEAAANAERAAAGERVVVARQQLEVARAEARRRLSELVR